MKKTIITLAVMFLSSAIYAGTVIDFSEYRRNMGGEKNARVVMKKILQDCIGKDNITISFPKDRYDFYPEYYTQKGPYDVGMDIIGARGITIEGNGSEFVFHGMMRVANAHGCTNITFRNFSIDWDRPLLSQCVVLDTTEDYMDVCIDREKYPYRIVDGRILFYGEGWEMPIDTFYMTVYNPDGNIEYNTWDGTVEAEFASAKVEELGEGRLRFHYHPKYKPANDCILELYHRRYAVSGIDVFQSKDVMFQNLTIYHTMGGGIWCGLCENVSEINVRIVANREKGRMFSTVADASHFTNCKGLITFRGCECSGQGDDFLNVHGKNVRINRVTGNYSVEAGSTGYFFPGDTVALVGKASGQREFLLTVSKSGKDGIFFNQELPSCVDTTYFLENMTWTPSFLFENNIVTKCNRARGILVTTPRHVVIRNNVFQSAGTAILIEGDTDFWFESGACNDVNIYGNVFDNCLTSGNRDGSRWQWGDGIITITPSHRPKDSESPSYHKNIRVYDNEFRVFDVPLMRACSVDGLIFRNNRIIRTYDYQPYTFYKDSFILEGCRNVRIKNNRYDKDYRTRTVRASIMKQSDIKAGGLKVSFSE